MTKEVAVSRVTPTIAQEAKKLKTSFLIQQLFFGLRDSEGGHPKLSMLGSVKKARHIRLKSAHCLLFGKNSD